MQFKKCQNCDTKICVAKCWETLDSDFILLCYECISIVFEKKPFKVQRLEFKGKNPKFYYLDLVLLVEDGNFSKSSRAPSEYENQQEEQEEVRDYSEEEEEQEFENEQYSQETNNYFNPSSNLGVSEAQSFQNCDLDYQKLKIRVKPRI